MYQAKISYIYYMLHFDCVPSDSILFQTRSMNVEGRGGHSSNPSKALGSSKEVSIFKQPLIG